MEQLPLKKANGRPSDDCTWAHRKERLGNNALIKPTPGVVTCNGAGTHNTPNPPHVPPPHHSFSVSCNTQWGVRLTNSHLCCRDTEA